MRWRRAGEPAHPLRHPRHRRPPRQDRRLRPARPGRHHRRRRGRHRRRHHLRARLGRAIEGIDEALDTLTAGESHHLRVRRCSAATTRARRPRSPSPSWPSRSASCRRPTTTSPRSPASSTPSASCAPTSASSSASRRFGQGARRATRSSTCCSRRSRSRFPQQLIDDEVHRHLEGENRLDDDVHRAEVTEASEKTFRSQSNTWPCPLQVVLLDGRRLRPRLPHARARGGKPAARSQTSPPRYHQGRGPVRDRDCRRSRSSRGRAEARRAWRDRRRDTRSARRRHGNCRRARPRTAARSAR